MIPVLYDRYSPLSSQGLGMLADCTRCEVTEEVNGTYECEFDYPMTGPMFDMLLNFGGTIAVTHDHNGDVQLFDIYKYSAPVDGIVTFNASHVSYRLSNFIVEGATGYIPADLFDCFTDPHYVLAKGDGTFTFTDYSGYAPDDDNPGVDSWIGSIRETLLDRTEMNNDLPSGCAIDVWPGEFVFDNFDVKYYKQRGANTGVEIRYGKNMNEVLRERDTGQIVSGVVPVWWNPDRDEYTGPTVFPVVYSPDNETITSPWEAQGEYMLTSDGERLYFKAADVRVSILDLSDQFETEPTRAKAKNAALAHMRKNATWRAIDTIEVEFVDLYDDPEYADIKELEKCSVGDRVTVLYPELGIVSKATEIMSGTYDVLAERFVSMQLNTIRTTLAQTIINYIGGFAK